ncbi:hypothetical protein GCM10010862_38830 [Devosia nitrariae]|uniref:Uncharacterized protein n=1 Tax=Devosia nitrariae TaxID=2071872 RepID=A0ABQ5WA31_9HYPH|nr:hypothetical protein GCM10010862_38830 [Devosia nitrariae]
MVLSRPINGDRRGRGPRNERGEGSNTQCGDGQGTPHRTDRNHGNEARHVRRVDTENDKASGIHCAGNEREDQRKTEIRRRNASARGGHS